MKYFRKKGGSKKKSLVCEKWPQTPIKTVSLEVFGGSVEYPTLFTFHKDRQKVPKIVRDAVTFLESEGLKHVGLYRHCGSTKNIESLRQRYDTYHFWKTNLSQDFAVDDVSSLLKLYLRELSPSLVPPFLCSSLVQIIDLYSGRCATSPLNAKDLIKLLRFYLLCLSESSYTTLGLLARHLHNVASKSSVNKMNHGNLIIIFSACLRIPPKVLLPLILHSIDIFPEQELCE